MAVRAANSHMMRAQNLCSDNFEGRLKGTASRGRPRGRWGNRGNDI